MYKTDIVRTTLWLWRVRVTMIRSNKLTFIIGVDIAVNTFRYRVLPVKCNSGFPFYCCRTTKYPRLLLTIIIIKYYECVCLYSCLNCPACKSHPFCTIFYCHLWSGWLYHILPLISRKWHDFLKNVTEHKMCFDFSLQTFVTLRTHAIWS